MVIVNVTHDVIEVTGSIKKVDEPARKNSYNIEQSR
jgi:hypothetical protein